MNISGKILESNGDYYFLKKENLFEEINITTSFLDNHYQKITVKQRYWHIKNNNYEIVYCKQCKNIPAKWNRRYEYVSCSKSCVDKLNSMMVHKKFKMDGANMKEKYKKTCMKRYGVYHISKDKTILEKIKNSLNIHHNNPKLVAIMNIKKEKTNIERFGVSNYTKTKEYKDMVTNSFKGKLVDKLSSDYKLVGFGINKKKKTNHLIHRLNHSICGNNFDIDSSILYIRYKFNHELCTYCNPPPKLGGSSSGEKELLKFIKSITDDDIMTNTRSIIRPYELDVYIPKKNLAFEYNGTYYHADPRIYKPSKTIFYKTAKEIWGKDKLKYELCIQSNIKLEIIWEADWKYNHGKTIEKIKKLIYFSTVKRIEKL